MNKKIVRYHWLFNRVYEDQILSEHKRDISNIVDDILNNVNFGISEDENLFIQKFKNGKDIFYIEKQIGIDVIWYVSENEKNASYVREQFDSAELVYTYDVRNKRRINEKF